MRIPDNAVIVRAKITEYLLVYRRKSDKSQFLAQAGFRRDDPDELMKAFRRLIAEYDAIEDRRNEYGIFYRVEGDLYGPVGVLKVVTVWLHREIDSKYWFVTLKPAR